MNIPANIPRPKTIEILIVDDDDDDVRLIRIGLIKTDGPPIRVHRCANGFEGLQFLKREPPFANVPDADIVLMDLNMPIMDGWEMLQAMQEDDRLRAIPVVVLSTSHNKSDIRASHRMGAKGFITKPDSLNELRDELAKIEEYLLPAGTRCDS